MPTPLTPCGLIPPSAMPHWVSLNPGVPGANGAYVFACAWTPVVMCMWVATSAWLDGAGQSYRQMGRQRLVALGLGD